MKPTIVAFDGIAVIVNEKSPLAGLTKRQVEQIFTGEVADWSAVGGSAGKISIYTRNTSSGTYAEFREMAMKKRDYAQAGEYFKRAAQSDSKDPRVHYYSALLMSREGSFADSPDLPQMTRELETAIALNPDFADSYMLLAFAQLYAGNPAKGLVSAQKAVSLSPRNEGYQFNLAQMYLNNQKLDDALAILRALQKSGNSEITRRAAQLLDQAQQYQAALLTRQAMRSKAGKESDGSANSGPIQIGKPSITGEDAQPTPAQVPLSFLSGTILSVDCSSPPAATLTVISGAKTWKMHVADSKHALVIGADEFSCSWSKQKVALNYRENGEADGNVVSIEVQ